MEARLAVRTAEERVRALSGRADVAAPPGATSAPPASGPPPRRAARARGAAVAARVPPPPRRPWARWPSRSTRAATERDALAASRSAREAELLEVRGRVRAATAELDRLTDEVHRDEVARAEQRLRIEQLETRAAEEFGVDLPTPARRVRPGSAPCRRRQEQLAAAEAAGGAGAASRGPTTAPSRRSGPPRPSATWPCSAR